MKKIVFIFITVFCMCCMVACGGEVKEDVSASSSNEVPDNSANDQPVVTEAPIDDVEATPAPTAAPTAEPTAAPTVEETLVSLKEKAMVEYNLIVEQIQHRFDIAEELLTIVEGYPNFQQNNSYENVLLTKTIFEEKIPKGNVNSTVDSINTLNLAISHLVEDYPDLKTTEAFKKFIEVPEIDTAFYDAYVSAYNKTLSNNSISGFEELPYCTIFENKIEY